VHEELVVDLLDEEEGYVRFWRAGVAAKGEFRCSGCGYGAIVSRLLPVCPMCGGEAWEQSTWSPSGRADAFV